MSQVISFVSPNNQVLFSNPSTVTVPVGKVPSVTVKGPHSTSAEGLFW